MFLPTIKDGLTEEEAVESLMGFAKRPIDEVKARDFSIIFSIGLRFDKLKPLYRLCMRIINNLVSMKIIN